MTIKEFAMQIVDAMQKTRYSTHAAYGAYRDGLTPIINFHEKNGKINFEPKLLDEYIEMIGKRIDRKEISIGHYRRLKRGADQMIEFHKTGKIEWSLPGKVSKFHLNEYFQNVLIPFLESENWHKNTHGDVTWIGKKYFAWLIENGYETLDGVGAYQVQLFMCHCNEHMRSSSVHNVKLYMKKLYQYLYDNGYSENTYRALLSFPVSRESRMFPAVSPEEINTILELMDTHVPKGKRDYAIILLGAVTGLRAIDIARLKLSDIDWVNGEIKILQSKTRKTLTLPLTNDVGEAIKDYILNGRQQTESEAIFLRQHAPFQGFAEGGAIEDMYDDYCKKAGFLREAFDGKGFHSLRRSVGKNMITTGISVATVAQVLGDSDINSAKKYISLDSHHLQECALDFRGIEVTSN